MNARTGPKPFPIAGAFGLSLAFHLLLLLLSVVVPFVNHSVADEPPEPPEITFSFAEPAETADDEPASDVPPVGTEPVPLFVPPEPPPAAPAPETYEPAPPPLEPVEPPAAGERPAADAGAEEAPVAPETAEETGMLPGAGEAGTGQQPPRRPSMDEALREFGDDLSRGGEIPQASTGSGSRNVITPDLSQIPSSGFGVGNLVFESEDFDWSDYGRQIYMAIWRAWHNRLWLTTDEFEKWGHQSAEWYLNHQTQVGFVIERNGQVTRIVHEGASGCPPLDASALDALAEVILPPLPADFPREREVVHARFIAIGELRAMRPQLGRLKQAGFF